MRKDIAVRSEQEFESPAWHESVLAEREERVRSGEEPSMDWEIAKKELRQVALVKLVGTRHPRLKSDP
jgi:hypothetical protein